MSANREVQNQVALLSRQIDTFYQVNRFISSIDNLDEVLELVMRESEAAVAAEASCIALYDPSDNLLHIEFASGEADQEVRHLTLAKGQGILGEVAETGRALMVDDVSQDPRFDVSFDRQSGFTTRCILATPIRRREELLGVLEVINKKDGTRFTEDDSHLLEVVANQAAIAIENARLFERMVQSEQLSVIGRMASSIIHDVKKPMQVIRGFAELLGNPDVDTEKRRTFPNLILEDVDRFLGMTQELLDYSRGTMSMGLKEVDLGDWLDNVQRFLVEQLADSRVELVTELAYRGPVLMDPERMRRVLINIAGNASDAMPDGGTLTIATRRVAEYWELEVQDTGTGIPVELRARIFEPFVTSGKEHGTGLGLSIAREIVEGHGGTIQVQSRVSGEEAGRSPGSTFLMRVPLEPSIGG